MIDVTVPAAVVMTTSDTTLSEMIFSIVPGKRFRMLVLIYVYRIDKCKERLVWVPRINRARKIRDLQKLETVKDLNIGLPTASHKEL